MNIRSLLKYQDDFEVALLKTRPSVSLDDLKQHEEFTKNFGVEG